MGTQPRSRALRLKGARSGLLLGLSPGGSFILRACAVHSSKDGGSWSPAQACPRQQNPPWSLQVTGSASHSSQHLKHHLRPQPPPGSWDRPSKRLGLGKEVSVPYLSRACSSFSGLSYNVHTRV